MFPNLYQYPKIRVPRPINPLDNPSTTGLLSNPNGTYVANTYPQGAASYGAQGAYGAMLPQVNVTGQPQLPVDQFFSNIGKSLSNWWNGPSGRPAGVGGPMGPGARPPAAIPQVNVPAPAYSASAAAQYAIPGQQKPFGQLDYKDAAARSSPISPLFQDRIIAGIAADPESFKSLTPAQRDAVENILVSAGGGGGPQKQQQQPGAGEFYGYQRNAETGRSERVVKSAAAGDNFSNELRWDPSRKKYVQIGKLMKEGKLDKYGGWHGKGWKKRDRDAGKSGRRGPSPRIGSYGVVTFNTGTG